MRKNNTVLMLTEKPFPPAIRAVKEGISLVDAGYSVIVMAPNDGEQPRAEVWRGIDIIRPPILNKGRIKNKLAKLLLQIFLFDLFWYLAVKSAIKKYQPVVIHVHDMWLGKTVLKANCESELIMDLHENMPAAVREYEKVTIYMKRMLSRILFSTNRLVRYEGKIIENYTKTIVVVKEARDRVLSTLKVNPKKVIVIENMENLSFIDQTKRSEIQLKGDYNVVYIGGFGPHRGLDTMIMALAYCRQQVNDFHMYLVGARPEDRYAQYLQNLARQEKVEDMLTIVGWVHFDEVLSLMKKSDIGVVPHHSNPHTDTTLPHKIYQYMMANIPVIASSSKPLARTLEETGGGLIFQAGDPEDLADKILTLYHDRVLAGGLAKQGYEVTTKKGRNWDESEEQKLIDLYQELFA